MSLSILEYSGASDVIVNPRVFRCFGCHCQSSSIQVLRMSLSILEYSGASDVIVIFSFTDCFANIETYLACNTSLESWRYRDYYYDNKNKISTQNVKN